MPLLVMVAGPNGSGKSTLTDASRASPDVELPATYINADEIQKASGCDPATAQQSAKALVLHDRLLLLAGASPVLGQTCHIAYREGVGAVKVLNSSSWEPGCRALVLRIEPPSACATCDGARLR